MCKLFRSLCISFRVDIQDHRKTEGKKKQLKFMQRAKKVVSDSPGLVDFSIGLVNSVFNLPDGQVMFFEEFE